MEIKLSPKKLAILQASQAKKAEINKMMAELTASENIIVELALEEAGVSEQVNNLKLDGDKLTFDIVKQQPKPKGKGAKMKASELVNDESKS